MLRPLGFAADFFRVLAEAEHQIGQLFAYRRHPQPKIVQPSQVNQK
jgi:hypothetical protein